jgi:hypothetical protein
MVDVYCREGPERLEAKAQIMRERLIAANEVMVG